MVGEGPDSSNFYYCKKLVLADMPNLTKIYLAENAFHQAATVKFKSKFYHPNEKNNNVKFMMT